MPAPFVFDSHPIVHPLRPTVLHGGRTERSSPKLKLRDFLDVERAASWLADRVAAGQPTIHAEPVVDYSLLIREWQMLLNDSLGDCTCASVAHGCMVFAAMLGVDITITNIDIEAMYEHSGWVPGKPETDQGWTLEAAAGFARTIGLLGTAAAPKPDIDAYAGVDVQDDEAQQIAMELFGGLSSGMECPRSALEQFQEGKPWTVVPGSEIAGGHAIWKAKSVLVPKGLQLATSDFVSASVYITWGGLVPADEAFDNEYIDEHLAFVPHDWEAKLPQAVLEAGIVDFSKLASLVGQFAS
jgi:hypothetical protein